MKELTIEQKAQRYDEAMEKLRNFYRDYDTVSRLIDVKDELANLFPELKESEDERIRKWLIEMVKEVRKANPTNADHNGNCSDAIAWLERQGEQSKEATYTHEVVTGNGNIKALVTEKVQLPNFKIGDTIVEKDFDECGYGTIKDIKDGQYIFTDGSAMNINEQGGWQLVKASTNIEQKPAWSEEDEEHVDSLLKRLDGLCRNEFERTRFAISEDRDWLKSLKDRVGCEANCTTTKEWSEEDIMRIDNLIAIIENKGYPDYVEYLEKLKDRVQPQPKQQWSEEDERQYRAAIAICNSLGHTNTADWLKSLRPHKQWKPSEEQMEALKSSTYCQDKQMSKVLFELYQDLKKLKE